MDGLTADRGKRDIGGAQLVDVGSRAVTTCDVWRRADRDSGRPEVVQRPVRGGQHRQSLGPRDGIRLHGRNYLSRVGVDENSATVHFACHGVFRSDNPMFSHLEMADGPLTVYDIFNADKVVTDNVILSACNGAEMSVRPEQAVIGMSGALLASGIRSIVASISPVRDDECTERLMVGYHRLRSQGHAPRHALALARVQLEDRTDRMLAGSFIALGAA